MNSHDTFFGMLSRGGILLLFTAIVILPLAAIPAVYLLWRNGWRERHP